MACARSGCSTMNPASASGRQGGTSRFTDPVAWARGSEQKNRRQLSSTSFRCVICARIVSPGMGGTPAMTTCPISPWQWTSIMSMVWGQGVIVGSSPPSSRAIHGSAARVQVAFGGGVLLNVDAPAVARVLGPRVEAHGRFGIHHNVDRTGGEIRFAPIGDPAGAVGDHGGPRHQRDRQSRSPGCLAHCRRAGDADWIGSSIVRVSLVRCTAPSW